MRAKTKIRCKACDAWGIVPVMDNLPFAVDLALTAMPAEKRTQREWLAGVVVHEEPSCNMQNKGHHKSCACPRRDGPELRAWLLRHTMFKKCPACEGKGKLSFIVAIERALKKEDPLHG